MMGLGSFLVAVSTLTFSLGWTVIEGTAAGALSPEYDVEVIGGESDSWESKLTCPRDVKPCLWICSPSEKERISTNESELEALPQIGTRFGGTIDTKTVSPQNFHLSYGDPCAFQWMVPSEYDEFYAVENGSISVGADFEEGSLYHLGYYCLIRNSESHEYSARVCVPLVKKSNWVIFYGVFVMLVSSAVVIVYTVIPEQKNFHGLLFRCYMATYGFVAVSVLGMNFTVELRMNSNLYSIAEAGAIYSCYGIVFWLNAMSFNIWRSFQELRSIDVTARSRRKRNFIWYAIYAWVIPAVLVAAIMLPIHYLPHVHYQIVGHRAKIWSCGGVIGMVYTCNGLFFTLTTLAIRRQRKDTIDLFNGVNRHDEITEEWFNLHVKLFVLMGGHIFFWVIWYSRPTHAMVHVVGASEVLQGTLIVKIFLWKDNVKRSFWKEVSPWWRSNSAVASRKP